jgi:uncharacterized protein YwgA
MAKIEEMIAHLLEASGGEIVGRIRLQKMIYLLDQLGLGSGLRFTYHHYGPYAEGITIATQRAEFINKTIQETETESSYGGKFSKFRLVNPLPCQKVGELDFERARNYATIMKNETSVVLELAATIHWLKETEKVLDWHDELISRKPQKASELNIFKAQGLLNQLGIAA